MSKGDFTLLSIPPSVRVLKARDEVKSAEAAWGPVLDTLVAVVRSPSRITTSVVRGRKHRDYLQKMQAGDPAKIAGEMCNCVALGRRYARAQHELMYQVTILEEEQSRLSRLWSPPFPGTKCPVSPDRRMEEGLTGPRKGGLEPQPRGDT